MWKKLLLMTWFSCMFSIKSRIKIHTPRFLAYVWSLKTETKKKLHCTHTLTKFNIFGHMTYSDKFKEI